MPKFLTFKKGGVHPDDMKALSKGSPIQRITMPKEIVISMSQHLGAPAACIKQKGDSVRKGELIGEASSFISANIHSPVSGKIVDIRKVTLANSVSCDALVIEPESDDDDTSFESPIDYTGFSSEELLQKVKESGLVGMGGATFPMNVKLSVPIGKKVDYLVLNGVECEPYLTADYTLMKEKTEEILLGAMIIARIVNPKFIKLGIEANKMDCVALFNEVIERKGYPIEVIPLKMKYPQGDEKQLLKATTGREIPSGKLPLDIGSIVCNVGTVYATYQAITFGKPLFERVVTVSGNCISKPGNFLAPIGTKVCDLIEAAGGFAFEPEKLISGGPMMGFSFWDLDTPITKGTSGILAIRFDEKPARQTNCIHCGKCVAACPIGLEPTRLYNLIKNGKYAAAMATDLMDCKECGCCAFSCPAHLPLVQAFRMGKKLGRVKK
ncbi:MAG: electron transport complex subunit RsxC [Sphaerochaetaceae bacterium]|jgi:Na+-translocating ferredoxin:NAD+ oxidoreductase subunit C|nr:electron transport complex subunit RsxC [Sphaerochaetaceae bacterium]NLY07676.1 electron transport complex subunit RsxC [Spirochaetales bacterium]